MLSSGIMQRAFAEAIILGLACGPLGVWIVLHRQSYAAESAAHAMLPGLVVAALVGAPLLLGAGVGVVAGAVAIAPAARDRRLGGDVAVGVVVTALFGLGAMLALSPDVPPRLGELLFGDLLGVTGGDLAQAGGLVAVTVAALTLGHRGLALAGFDRDGAAATRTPPPAPSSSGAPSSAATTSPGSIAWASDSAAYVWRRCRIHTPSGPHASARIRTSASARWVSASRNGSASQLTRARGGRRRRRARPRRAG